MDGDDRLENGVPEGDGTNVTEPELPVENATAELLQDFQVTEPDVSATYVASPNVEDKGERSNVFSSTVKYLADGRYTWGFLKGFIVLLVALKIAHAFELISCPVGQMLPFGDLDWEGVKEFLQLK